MIFLLFGPWCGRFRLNGGLMKFFLKSAICEKYMKIWKIKGNLKKNGGGLKGQFKIFEKLGEPLLASTTSRVQWC